MDNLLNDVKSIFEKIQRNCGDLKYEKFMFFIYKNIEEFLVDVNY